jgi:hypothetical protein
MAKTKSNNNCANKSKNTGGCRTIKQRNGVQKAKHTRRLKRLGLK